jgi:Na+-translocating ferredoxin:NAD+ oxidoreductase RnfG subunit
MPETVRTFVTFAMLTTGCAALLAVTAWATRPAIEANRQRQFAETLSELAGQPVDPSSLRWESGRGRLCDGTLLLRGRAAGYAGAIDWLAAAATDEAATTLRALRVVAHQETPGIADFLYDPQRGWLASLSGRSAADLAEVDTVSGATITTRALRRDLVQALLDASPAPPQECPP